MTRASRIPPVKACRSCGRPVRSWREGPLCEPCTPKHPVALVRADPFRPRRPDPEPEPDTEDDPWLWLEDPAAES